MALKVYLTPFIFSDRLLNKARAEKLDFNMLLTRYALERLLYRLSVAEQ